MASEVEEIYRFENGFPHNWVIEAEKEFCKKYEQRPAKAIFNPKYREDMGDTSFIPSAPKPMPAIEPLGLKDINAHIAQGYHLPNEYSEEVDEHTLKLRGFAFEA